MNRLNTDKFVKTHYIISVRRPYTVKRSRADLKRHKIIECSVLNISDNLHVYRMEAYENKLFIDSRSIKRSYPPCVRIACALNSRSGHFPSVHDANRPIYTSIKHICMLCNDQRICFTFTRVVVHLIYSCSTLEGSFNLLMRGGK